MSAFASVVARGTRASQPSAGSLPVGSLYYVTDESKIERNNGSSWDQYSQTPVTAGDGIDITAGAVTVKLDGSTLSKSASGLKVSSAASGKIAQVVNVETGAVNTGSTVIPLDDTIPQITEGNEYMTLAITPTSATNKLRIEVTIFLTSLVANWLIAALFQDATSNALAAAAVYQGTGTGGVLITFTHYMTAGTTSATTFRVRAGRDASAGTTVTFNGAGGARLFGGVMASSITITEIVP